MKKVELDTLYDLCQKLLGERLAELDEEYPDEYVYNIYNTTPEDLYELDDYDRLVEGLDLVLAAISDMKGTD